MWWPFPHPTSAYWPPGEPRVETLDSFILAFRTLGYELAYHARLEPGFEKVAIYADANGTPTHMARQLESGAWTSSWDRKKTLTMRRWKIYRAVYTGGSSRY